MGRIVIIGPQNRNLRGQELAEADICLRNGLKILPYVNG